MFSNVEANCSSPSRSTFSRPGPPITCLPVASRIYAYVIEATLVRRTWHAAAHTNYVSPHRRSLPFLISEQERVLDPSLVNWRIPKGFGCTGRPLSLRVRLHGSCPWSRYAGAGVVPVQQVPGWQAWRGQ